MVSPTRVNQIGRSLAALGLLVMGVTALIAPRQVLSLDHVDPLPFQVNLSRQLLQREITLHQRSEAESMLMEFTLAQMTRHYWGEFAGSLQDLGLSAGPQLVATVDRDDGRTRLWIQPHHGTEAYLAQVERWDGRLRMRHCRGHRDGTGLGREDRCPVGWQTIHLN